MAKQTQETEKKTVEENPVLEVKDFVSSPTKSKSLPVLKRGEILISEADESGKEVNHFISNQKTFDDFYSKNKKFSIKKK
ncbi:hypothetical protein [Chryseobacterium indoltheticum]|uniref:Uncharacterized protein n=1 Tax=Chryseobacterium indoltheticum TaxID=254 RepID=A0A381F3T0_9FLAO|nr:hypothetical protein [Chryseobacterium indoltheticum]AZA74785.1 hypothetical protein EG358_13875 [Chryseobacterium indoltheticum]SIQ35410.1 hypothetical protein SAMN05421682_104191 [Chryseobacterium indoltheticum]SUX41221.1 Uncharacterised protein [Chryseobacterium indoltheticum]